MKLKFNITRFGPALVAFTLVLVGSLIALPNDEKQASANQQVPVVVAAKDLASGTAASEVWNSIEVRMVPKTARAAGAFESVAEIPDGVLAYPHVVGQQILGSSFSENQIFTLGAGYVAVSVRVESQRWIGPYVMAGKSVNIYDTNITAASLVSSDAVILGTPETDNLEPKSETVISLGVKQESLTAVLVAASQDRIWLVSR